MVGFNISRLASTLLIFILCFILALPVAAEIRFEDLPNQEVYNDFVVGPGKVELLMRPGETRTVEIKLSNRLGETRDFQLQVEDFSGSQSSTQPVVLYGTQRGPYSLRDYIYPEQNALTIDHSKRAVVPITVSIPEDAEPGGLYGSVLFSVQAKSREESGGGGAAAGATIISRIGVLFFVRVAGEVEEEARLLDFRTKNNQSFYTQGPVPFEVEFENTGSVHVNPYGIIRVKNMFGQIIGEQSIDPWFTLPGSLRAREIEWNRPLLIGRYTAEVELNRGYDDIVDSKSVSIWVVPVKLIGLILLVLIVLFVILRFIFSRVEIRVR